MSAATQIDRSKCPMIPDLSELSAEELARIASRPLRCANCGDVLELACNRAETFTLGESVDVAVDAANALILIPRSEYSELLAAAEALTGPRRFVEHFDDTKLPKGRLLQTRDIDRTMDQAISTMHAPMEAAAGDRIQLERDDASVRRAPSRELPPVGKYIAVGHHEQCRLEHGGQRCSCRRHGWQPPA